MAGMPATQATPADTAPTPTFKNMRRDESFTAAAGPDDDGDDGLSELSGESLIGSGC